MSDKAPRRKDKPADAGPQPEGVGGTLRHRRQMRGQSLEAVYQATRIPRGLLQALEEERYAEFPAPVYMRSFLKTYCEYLELEFEPLWQKAAPPPRSPDEDADDAPEPSLPPDERDSSPWASPPVFLFGGLVLLGLLGWGTLKLFAGRKAPAPPPAVEETLPAPIAAPPPEAPAEDPARFVGPVAPPPADPTKLVVTSLKDGWVSLRRDGQLVFEGRLPVGKHLDYRGARFELHASDPAGLRLELGGEPLSLSSLKPEHDGGYRFAPK
ncbi:MAG: helix-turn-helix domain-containing protein [Elusimicrobia bacterium]|nr:helix-turn-helix domain-containing protein [Elusimicrobiota bacterium]